MANETRTTRDADSRAADKRPMTWAPAQLLPDPAPEPGYAFRWIRLSTMGEVDPKNISAKLREGWEPVKATMHPEIPLTPGLASRYPDSIEIGGLMLCKTPVEMVEQRDAHFRKQANMQMESVDNSLMKESDPRMPIFMERKTQVKFGKGSNL